LGHNLDILPIIVHGFVTNANDGYNVFAAQDGNRHKTFDLRMPVWHAFAVYRPGIIIANDGLSFTGAISPDSRLT